ncbi:protein-L-isoaspartate O-methyltransferase family protein [Tunturiibacter gelidiferens]|uniref:protein-L-isoaspartate O-methyltransferase family protein n=1 Tax=Tunturiibacter gelidiferens TaxID=3069689 RepID=UPI003D9ACE2D
MERIPAHRLFFANLITASAGLPPNSELASAFASTPRENFVGPPPWHVFTHADYIQTPSDDPACLYQDVVVSLGAKGHLNNGQPTLHALCIAAMDPRKGEHVVHIGAGTGYYTTLLAKLVGETGAVDAYEIEPTLAQRATENLAVLPHVKLHLRSGAVPPLPECDVLYVSAGATHPLAIWLDALRPRGRLIVPLTPSEGYGAMLHVIKREDGTYAAHFLTQVQFVSCIGARDAATDQKLTKLFRKRSWTRVRSLHRDDQPDDSCWCSGPGWWLSTR